jgi:hypothetical protein
MLKEHDLPRHGIHQLDEGTVFTPVNLARIPRLWLGELLPRQKAVAVRLHPQRKKLLQKVPSPDPAG